jgi:predicted NUDIX family phosphoesterase
MLAGLPRDFLHLGSVDPMSTVVTERVLVVPTNLFHRLGHFQGFSTEVERYLPTLLDSSHTSYRPRGEVEQDPSYKQLIPYVIFCYRSPGGVELFQYQRGKGQGEGRLHSKLSIGVGGHISSEDATAAAPAYVEGMRRELDEEVFVDTPYNEQCVGLLNDDQSEVGRVHLGVVHLVEVERPAVRGRESDLVEAGFRPLSAIRDDRERLETWSQICLDALFH